MSHRSSDVPSPAFHEIAGWNSRPILFVLAMGVFAGAASMRILDSLLPQIAGHYGHSVGTAGMVVTAYAFTYSGFQIFYGPLGDRLGPFRIITLAALCSGVAALGCALAPTLGWLVGLRLIAGAIAAAIGPLTLTWISLVSSAERRPVVIANITGASIAGTTAGQVGGGILGAFISWQASFVAIGALFLIAGFFMFHTGRSIPKLHGIGRQTGRKSSRQGLATLHALLRRSSVQIVLVPVFLEGFAMFMSFTYLSAFIEDQLSLGMAEIAMLLAFFGAGGITFVLIARPMTKCLAENRRAFTGGTLIAAGYFGLTVAPSFLAIAAVTFMLGLGFMMLHNVLQVRATYMAPEAPGAGISLFASTFFLAQAVGASFGGWAFDRFGAMILFALSAAIFMGVGIVLGRRTGTGADLTGVIDDN